MASGVLCPRTMLETSAEAAHRIIDWVYTYRRNSAVRRYLHVLNCSSPSESARWEIHCPSVSPLKEALEQPPGQAQRRARLQRIYSVRWGQEEACRLGGEIFTLPTFLPWSLMLGRAVCALLGLHYTAALWVGVPVPS